MKADLRVLDYVFALSMLHFTSLEMAGWSQSVERLLLAQMQFNA